jgi:hypothetical protein
LETLLLLILLSNDEELKNISTLTHLRHFPIEMGRDTIYNPGRSQRPCVAAGVVWQLSIGN